MKNIDSKPIRPLNRGTICRVACQCRCPDTGALGSFLYSGEVKDKGCRVSPVFSGVLDLLEWIHDGKSKLGLWEYMPGCVMIYRGE